MSRKTEAKECRGLKIEKYFHRGKDPYKETTWVRSDVDITNDDGKIEFSQKGVEHPESWSPLAVKVSASKYLYGDRVSLERESSIRQLVGRICETVTDWGIKDEYFNEVNGKRFHYELARLCLDQKLAFNSPVEFNVGTDRYASRRTNVKKRSWIISKKDQIIKYETPYGPVDIKVKKGDAIPVPRGREHEYPQTSACFIQSVKDTMKDIMDLAVYEAFLFTQGSGTGTDLSTLRSSREKLSGGGKPSGPLAYDNFYDRVAAIVKSGGKTRRAAKMNSLRAEHPDILEFVVAKEQQEDMIDILIKAGVKPDTAKEFASYQNVNLSVRATDRFMQAVEKGEKWKTIPVHNKELEAEMPEYNARDLFNTMAHGTWRCGDPGMQFHDTINRWHTCPNSGPINASNPCSEYMSVDDSSCNLASLNLMKFKREDGTFDLKAFEKAIRILTIAQDLLYDNSSFPRKEIAENSHRLRPLGMGYANLGALVMSMGLPYDSDEARAVASSITSFMSATVYETSAELAKHVGAFEDFERNKEPMLNVIKMHKDASLKIDAGKLKGSLEQIVTEIRDAANSKWEKNVLEGGEYGFRNAQATVLAPTGTIGFMMDCDTTGIEPDTWLVKSKLLAGGGVLRIVNNTISAGLRTLGYDPDSIRAIVEYVNQNGTVEGSTLKEEHLPVFDCTYKSKNGKRAIAPMGHLKMMAAVQPFLSGAISKTVGVDKKDTPKLIADLYMNAWKMGLKAVAIYRDKSKKRQPLSGVGGLEKGILGGLITGKPVRRKLPITRDSITHKFNLAGHEGYLTVGLYEDKTPGELFITMSKEGSTIGGLMDTVGTLTSFALQYGIPLKDLANKLRNNRFEPYGVVFEGDKDIKTAVSLTDYIFTWMAKRFNCLNKANPTAYDEPGDKRKDKEKKNGAGDKEEDKVDKNGAEDKPNEDKKTNDEKGEPGGFCPVCESQMYKFGHCEERCGNGSCLHIEYTGCGK